MAKSTQDEIDDLKEATRKAHEALRDLARATRQVKDMQREMSQFAERAVAGYIDPVVEEYLRDFNDKVGKAINEATDAVFKRFDTIRDVLLGEDKKSRREGKPTIPELAERKMGHGRH